MSNIHIYESFICNFKFFEYFCSLFEAYSQFYCTFFINNLIHLKLERIGKLVLKMADSGAESAIKYILCI